MPERPQRPEKSSGRIALEAIGMIVMVLTGGCSLIFLVSGGMNMFLPALVFGGVPFGLGLLIYRAGRWIDR